MRDEFSVYWTDRDGGQHEELRFVSAEHAMRAARRLTSGPGAVFVRRVLITDGGDLTCFEWRDGRVDFDGRVSVPWAE